MMTIKACSLSSPQIYGHIALITAVAAAATAITLFYTINLGILPTSLIAGGSGICVAIAIALYISACCMRNKAEKQEGATSPSQNDVAGPSDAPSAKDPEQMARSRNLEIFQNTRHISNRCGYKNSQGREVLVNNFMVRYATEFVAGVKEMPSPTYSGVLSDGQTTRFKVVQKDCLDTAMDFVRHQSAGSGSPLVLNIAHPTTPGGDVLNGGVGREENICRRTNLYAGLDELSKIRGYSIPDFGSIYSPEVVIFKDAEGKLYDKAVSINVISVAAFNLNDQSSDREKFKGTDGLFNFDLYKEATKRKIRNMLKVAHYRGNKDLILGALGCGVSKNDPNAMAGFFKEVFDEPEFKNAFNSVTFAIDTKSDTEGSNPDFTAFEQVFNGAGEGEK